ncbi:hypothetical protein QJ48_30455 [Paenibacillus sp. A3]|uniref:hypothetical protein n=1 Tax=Paenibacillus sp. A3 TaxID=1337054 RepID=UPI0006D5547B|nr:hypothetical protein [Paenibacillus sp. A3]KPV55914.1 hypothetical protein QJ48_30455 [Paenibacillus sp. A3]
MQPAIFFKEASVEGLFNSMTLICGGFFIPIPLIVEFDTVEEMFSNYAAVNGSLDGAILVVDTLAKALALGADVYKNGTVYDVPVMVQSMNGKADMILMNPLAYGVSIDSTEVEAHVVDGKASQDTTAALKGYDEVYAEVLAHGKVLNPLAIKIYKAPVGGASISEPEFVEMNVASAEPVKKSRKVKGE